jgi:pimeloyl-ACP methyl ester carboxylesterase
VPDLNALLTALLAFCAALLVLWALIVLGLWWQQDRLIFAGWGFRLVAASGIGPADERLELVTPDGVRLVGALRRAPRASRGLLLVFSGNAEDTDWRLRHLGNFVEGFDVATFFYRGYGPSGGVPDVLIHDHLVDRLRPERVVAAGFSLGSGVAAQLARLRPLAGAILVTPFDSVESVAAARYPWAPVRWLLRHPFRSDEALAGLDLPVAVIAAGRDVVVPPKHARRLLEGLKRPVLAAWVEGAGHVSIYERPEYRAAFSEALDLVLRAAGASPAAAEASR